jgi:hypothetical protein
MVLNDIHPGARGGGELYLILIVAATMMQRLMGRSGCGSTDVDSVLSAKEELGRTTEEERAVSRAPRRSGNSYRC